MGICYTYSYTRSRPLQSVNMYGGFGHAQVYKLMMAIDHTDKPSSQH